MADVKKKIIVTGSSGQLGSELKELARDDQRSDFLFFSRDQLEITNESSVKNILELHRPQFLINCAAYTAVDKAETERQLARQVNGTAVGNLAKHCAALQIKFLHLSTDYVFNGEAKSPLRETDLVDPINYYGQSKLAGEQLAFQNNPQSIVIRTSWVYSHYGHNFVKTMIRLMKERESINVVNDQYGSPTYAFDLAEAIIEIIGSGRWASGIYNFSNEGIISWYDFANEIKRQLDFSCKINPISTSEFPTPATRPAWSVLDNSKIQQTYGIKLKPWQESLQRCIDKLA